MSTTIDLADAVVTTVVASGSTLLIGLVWGRREKATERLVQPRLARREELRHRAPELPDEGDPETTDTTAPESDDEQTLTGRQRWTAGGMDAAVAMRERRRVLHLSTQEIEIHAAAVAASTDWSAVERALSGQAAAEDVPPLFRETRALLTPTGAYPIVATQPDNPPSDPTIPTGKPLNKRSKSRKRHAHGGVR